MKAVLEIKCWVRCVLSGSRRDAPPPSTDAAKWTQHRRASIQAEGGPNAALRPQVPQVLSVRLLSLRLHHGRFYFCILFYQSAVRLVRRCGFIWEPRLYNSGPGRSSRSWFIECTRGETSRSVYWCRTQGILWLEFPLLNCDRDLFEDMVISDLRRSEKKWGLRSSTAWRHWKWHYI